MSNRYGTEKREGQIGNEEFDYEKYMYEQRRIEEDLDNIEDEKMSRKGLLMNIKMYDDSMKEMEIIKDRLELWKESLEGLNESIGRDALYVKEIAIKVVERKVEEVMSERKIILKKMMDKLENFTNVIKTSMDCMSNSIIDFEKKVYNSQENGDYLAFDYKSNNRICKSYYQLCQRLKEYLRNISPYFKDNFELDFGLNMEMNMGLGIDLNQKISGTHINHRTQVGNNSNRFECENSELKSIILEESKLLREPVILLINPKRMQTINLRNKINRPDLEEILSSSVTLNSSNDSFSSKQESDLCNNHHFNMKNGNYTLNGRGCESKHVLGSNTSTGVKFEEEKEQKQEQVQEQEQQLNKMQKQEQKQDQTRERGSGCSDEENGHFDTDVSISIKRVKHKLGCRGLKDRSRSKSRSKSKSNSRCKSRSISEPRMAFKKESELKINKIRGLVSELESELGSQSETESRIYIKKGKSNGKGKIRGRSGNSVVSKNLIEEKSISKNKPKTKPDSQNARFKKKGSYSSSNSSFSPLSNLEYDSDSNFGSVSDSSSGSEMNLNGKSRKSKIKLRELIKDYSNLYAEYIVSKNLSKINTYY
ncbi:uncharacterized protein cubi_01971 [Cryptosporidium ubiquitum]|uniref:Uncharacterized protein n=1 Tax=Cryptosporidium ubiquitum TaxID=857276 RepID=A0A1J4MMF5_9CRYT|nr:uncharacterized protein cubi_01971 [Cryptosporidium ubiquitum]OII75450.1 hypothetical protein cubi_01971 [Cryptosporidium ubiquitum]